MPQFNTDLDCEFLGELPAVVYFDHTKAQEEIINAPVENCQEALAEEADITDVIITIEGIKMSVISLMPSFYVTELEERAIAFINEQGE